MTRTKTTPNVLLSRDFHEPLCFDPCHVAGKCKVVVYSQSVQHGDTYSIHSDGKYDASSKHLDTLCCCLALPPSPLPPSKRLSIHPSLKSRLNSNTIYHEYPTATATMASHKTPPSSQAVFGQFAASNFVQGGGVAIFHIKSERVVICSAEDRTGRTYYFLPKGRRDAGEDAARGAEREGFEEVYTYYTHMLCSFFLSNIHITGCSLKQR